MKTQPYLMRYQFIRSNSPHAASLNATSFDETAADLQFLSVAFGGPGDNQEKAMEIKAPELHLRVQQWRHMFPKRRLSFASAQFEFRPSVHESFAAFQRGTSYDYRSSDRRANGFATIGEETISQDKALLPRISEDSFTIKLLDVKVDSQREIETLYHAGNQIYGHLFRSNDSVCFRYSSKHHWGHVPPHVLHEDVLWGIYIPGTGV